VFQKFKAYKALLKNELEDKVKVSKSENSGEYTFKAFEVFITTHSIQHQNSTPYTPQLKDVAKHANLTFVKITCTILHV